MKTFERLESNVRTYCRAFPAVFRRASGHTLVDERGERYIDFFAGAGVLNYGHNHPHLKSRLLDYVSQDGITHSLDMATVAKRDFLDALDRIILQPRQLKYKVMFPGPTGTNAVEAALKVARKVTGRSNVIAFTNGFHGMTLGALSLTANHSKRAGAGIPLTNVTRAPFDGYLGPDIDTTQLLDQYLGDPSSGWEPPAAIVVETVQAEGGINVASHRWLGRLAQLAKKYQSLLIVDDIQVGCGRTGPFFSFEPAEVMPDIVCLSKSLSGYGLPLAVTLFKDELDQWAPGEHNGTFRGHNPAFVTATAALEHFWTNGQLTEKVKRDAREVREVLLDLAEKFGGEVRGRGMIQGIELEDPSAATAISQAAFQRGLVIETAGPRDEVVKILPPLTIDSQALEQGLKILADAVAAVLTSPPAAVSQPLVAKNTVHANSKTNGKG